MTFQTTRRDFLVGAAAAGAALVVGFDTLGALDAGPADAQLNPFVKIGADGAVTVVLKHFEMGQGTSTGLAVLVAEELDADWAGVHTEFAPADGSRYANLFFGSQGTGGSTAIANSFLQYRKAGAAAREVLVRAAAEAWGVAAEAVSVENGILKAGDRHAHFGEMAARAAALTPSAEPLLKAPDRFRLIGDAKLRRRDGEAKTNGTATFALDVKRPDMAYAVILRAPKFGGKLVSFDASTAESVAGFLEALALPNGAGVAVYARSTWAAIQARQAISAEWDFAAAETRSTAELTAYHAGLLDSPQHQARPGGDFAVAGKVIEGAARIVADEFAFPYLAHAPMEPLNCVIEPTEVGVLFHDGCQFPGMVQPVVASVLGLEPEQVEIRTVYAGGSFGRRATMNADYQAEAAMAFDLVDRQIPVKLVWTREDDLAGGFYRPMAAHRARIGLDADGRIVGWEHRIATQSIIKGTVFESALVKDGLDLISVEGCADTHYAIPNMAVGLADAETKVPVLWWRSVGHTHNAYAMEVLMDMAAEAVGADPVAFRLALLPDRENADQRRLAGVLELAAEKAGWGAPVGPGRGRGVALHKSFGSYVAEVAEVSVGADGLVKLERMVCAVDCGLVVNPDVVVAQMEGGIGFGLGAVMRNRITLADGVVEQANFPDYEPLRITDMPKVEVHIVPSTEPPTGVGEPGVPPAGPALANAIYVATGKRVTRLPMTEAGVAFA
jgi:isoquinoline 1-oxidoreductase beta subunit